MFNTYELKFMKLLYRTGDYAFIISAIGNCLQQPGHIRNQLHKSMPETSIHLLNFVHPDSSSCRDKVSRAIVKCLLQPGHNRNA
jgi:hypothetical protein